MKSLPELRKLPEKELEEELLILRKEQFALRLKKSNGVLDKPHQIKEIRRAVARIKTLKTEKRGKSDDNK